MADTNRSKDAQRSTLEFTQCLWGDLIYGTKQELQDLGIGKGIAFPGEPGGPKRVLCVTDPRGFDTRVTHRSDDIYYASINFPGRESPELYWCVPASIQAPGVQGRGSSCVDEYIGTAEALSDAGLVRMDQFPGQPGMRKVRVTIFPDGTIPTGAPTANHRQKYLPGAKEIERESKTTFKVTVRISEDEKARRDEAEKHAKDDYEARMHSLPRPAPLPGLPRPTHSPWDLRPNGSNSDLAQFTSLDDYRSTLLTLLPILMSGDPRCLAKFDGLASTDGYKYGITPDGRERIEDAIKGLYLALRGVEVYRRKYDARTDAEKAAARQLVAKAETNQPFQRFLGRLIGQTPPAA